MVRQVKGLDCIVKGRGTIVGHASGMGQGVGVDSQDWAILVSDVGGELSILGMLTMSMHLPAAMAVVTTLSLGRSVPAATAIGPILLLLLLLLLGELEVRLLVLYSAELVGLRGLATAAVRCTLLLKREGGHLDDAIRLQGLDLAGQGLAENLSYNLHSRRELAEDDHCLHVGRELVGMVIERSWLSLT